MMSNQANIRVLEKRVFEYQEAVFVSALIITLTTNCLIGTSSKFVFWQLM